MLTAVDVHPIICTYRAKKTKKYATKNLCNIIHLQRQKIATKLYLQQETKIVTQNNWQNVQGVENTQQTVLVKNVTKVTKNVSKNTFMQTVCHAIKFSTTKL